jgi:hypothetical protein
MGFVDRLTGKSTSDAIQRGAEGQAVAGGEASALLNPFAAIGQQGIEQAGFLTDPQARFDFLQNNPLFQAAQAQGQNVTSNAQDALFKTAAARGRLSAGDTLQQIQQLGDASQNSLLLAASPLIQQQRQSIGDLINLGVSTAGNQGNLLTGQAAALAAGDIGAANARSAGAGNILNLGAQIGGFALGAFGGGPGTPGLDIPGVGGVTANSGLTSNVSRGSLIT